MRLTKQIFDAQISGETASRKTGYTHPLVPGLAIARAHNESGWTLTHLGTGLRVGSMMPTKQIAILTLERLIPADIDWTLDRDNLLKIYSASHVQDIVTTAIVAALPGRLQQKSLLAA